MVSDIVTVLAKPKSKSHSSKTKWTNMFSQHYSWSLVKVLYVCVFVCVCVYMYDCEHLSHLFLAGSNFFDAFILLILLILSHIVKL